MHAEALSKYRQAFRLLWRVKRVEWLLNSRWKQMTQLSRLLDDRQLKRHFPKLIKILHK